MAEEIAKLRYTVYRQHVELERLTPPKMKTHPYQKVKALELITKEPFDLRYAIITAILFAGYAVAVWALLR